MNTNLNDFFRDRVSRFASRPAMGMRLRYRTLAWTWRELGARADSLAAALGEAGVGKGDRVLLFSPNLPHWTAAFFAALSRGAAVVPLNPQSPPEQLNRIMRACEPKALLKFSRLAWAAAPLPAIDIDLEIPGPAGRVPEAPAEIRESDMAEIIYTSGTTGEPKGVVLTHGNILSNLEALAELLPITPRDHVFSIVPLFHVYGQLAGMFYPLYHGAPAAYVQSLSSRAILETLSSVPVTHMIAVPEFLKTVMDRLEARLPRWARRRLLPLMRRRISKTLHTVACGGAPLDPGIEGKWRLMGIEVLQGYGLTETSPVISTNTYREHKLGSVGKPLPGVQVKLAADGEVLVRGPNVMAGYYRNEKITADSFDGPWLKTGDIGGMDGEGFLYVSGRRNYMILGPGGENVFPEDIEAELNRLAGVRGSAVVGLEKGGRTAIHASLLCEREICERVVQEANKRLAPHQRIMEWSLWPQPDFPRSATRKVRKGEVIKWLESRGKKAGTGPADKTTALIRVLSQVTGYELSFIRPETVLVPELMIDSLLRIELVSRIEEELGVYIEERTITPKTTVRDLEGLILERKGRAPKMDYPRWSLGAAARSVRPALRSLARAPWLAGGLRVSGMENLPEGEGPVIFMPNHKSYLDSAAVLAAMPRRFRRKLAFAAATDVLYRRFFWFVPIAELVFNSYPFPSEADENIKPGLDYTGRLIDDGWSVVVYPEGRMNPTSRPVLPLKGGAGLMAVEMGVDVVPVAVTGTEKIMPPGDLFPGKFVQCGIRFGRPLRFGSGVSYHQATAEIQKALEELLA